MEIKRLILRSDPPVDALKLCGFGSVTRDKSQDQRYLWRTDKS